MQPDLETALRALATAEVCPDGGAPRTPYEQAAVEQRYAFALRVSLLTAQHANARELAELRAICRITDIPAAWLRCPACAALIAVTPD